MMSRIAAKHASVGFDMNYHCCHYMISFKLKGLLAKISIRYPKFMTFAAGLILIAIISMTIAFLEPNQVFGQMISIPVIHGNH
jgi:hypothetical protein